MRIAVVAPLTAPLLERSARGNRQVLLDVARGLRDRGHDVTVFCRQGSDVSGVRLEEVRVDEEQAQPAHADRETTPVERDMLKRGYEAVFDRIRAFRPDVVSQHAFDA